MILTARRSLVAKVARHQPPQIDIFFLNINVNRNRLVEDSLKEVCSVIYFMVNFYHNKKYNYILPLGFFLGALFGFNLNLLIFKIECIELLSMFIYQSYIAIFILNTVLQIITVMLFEVLLQLPRTFTYSLSISILLSRKNYIKVINVTVCRDLSIIAKQLN